jgi:hypothetical protein
MLPLPEEDEPGLDEPFDAVPVMTWSPGCRPEMTWVVTPSEMPAWIGTRTGAPLRRTKTLALGALGSPG